MSSERVRIKNISAKSILVKSNLPDTDLVFNPYIVCQFAGAYCYASFMGRSVVGITVTTDDDRLGRELEAYSPPATIRLNTLKSLTAAGIETYVFLGPLLPYYVEWPNKLEHLIGRVAEAGVRSVYVEPINPSQYIAQRIEKEIQKYAPNRASLLRKHAALSARRALEDLIIPLLQH